jgi:pimeloyl-ACP methyl ester carboxylesterase
VDDEAGQMIRRIAFDNLHELTMDESAEEELDPPAAHRLGEIDAPTLVMIAAHDPPFMRRTGDLIARGILGARKITIDGADHVVNLRQPEVFNEALLAFLAEVR